MTDFVSFDLVWQRHLGIWFIYTSYCENFRFRYQPQGIGIDRRWFCNAIYIPLYLVCHSVLISLSFLRRKSIYLITWGAIHQSGVWPTHEIWPPNLGQSLIYVLNTDIYLSIVPSKDASHLISFLIPSSNQFRKLIFIIYMSNCHTSSPLGFWAWLILLLISPWTLAEAFIPVYIT